MVVLASLERYWVTTKSSIESAKTTAALAMIAGASSGSSTRSNWSCGGAPRSAAASSYSLPIDTRRPRTMTTTYESQKSVMTSRSRALGRARPERTDRIRERTARNEKGPRAIIPKPTYLIPPMR